ncbi:hypothetical protein [Denitromonas ohlonensis]|uniref:Uncharacterized protein n=2 Tax=Denitromonas TaxID=139331 RepID=A0A557SQJ2_9RHOO|nr:hypothetical protein [Denitromonas ohlonensis]TVO66816.1 hypothetical protein FHP90_09085 [Denitromonas ohlonensis]TVO79686.1 hypothetical protein FHP89_00270 [Denitromonas ohlonensis]
MQHTHITELAAQQLDCPVLFGSISDTGGRAPRPAGERADRANRDAYPPLSELAMVAILSEN